MKILYDDDFCRDHTPLTFITPPIIAINSSLGSGSYSPMNKIAVSNGILIRCDIKTISNQIYLTIECVNLKTGNKKVNTLSTTPQVKSGTTIKVESLYKHARHDRVKHQFALIDEQNGNYYSVIMIASVNPDTLNVSFLKNVDVTNYGGAFSILSDISEKHLFFIYHGSYSNGSAKLYVLIYDLNANTFSEQTVQTNRYQIHLISDRYIPDNGDIVYTMMTSSSSTSTAIKYNVFTKTSLNLTISSDASIAMTFGVIIHNNDYYFIDNAKVSVLPNGSSLVSRFKTFSNEKGFIINTPYGSARKMSIGGYEDLYYAVQPSSTSEWGCRIIKLSYPFDNFVELYRHCFIVYDNNGTNISNISQFIQTFDGEFISYKNSYAVPFGINVFSAYTEKLYDFLFEMRFDLSDTHILRDGDYIYVFLENSNSKSISNVYVSNIKWKYLV